MENDRAEVICLGCAGMGDLAEEIQAVIGVPVVEGVAAAVKLAEALHTLGLSTSKSRTYAPMKPRAVLGWPFRSTVPAGSSDRDGAETPSSECH